MAAGLCLLPSLIIGLLGQCSLSISALQVDPMPAPDGHLHIYHLPVGVGDSMVIQCPDGVLAVIDTGAVQEFPGRFWEGPGIRTFIDVYMPDIRNILVSHNHIDHHNLMPSAFNDSSELAGLQNIYISCTAADMHPDMASWVTAIGADDKVREFNGGGQCGPVGNPCGNINICPNNPEIVYEVLGANLGQQCSEPNFRQIKNMDSIVSKITYNDITILLPGDIEDATPELDEDGPLRWIVDFYGPSLQVTYSHVALHGGVYASNKPHWINGTAPTFITLSGDPWAAVAYPRCQAFEGFLATGALCKPAVTDPADSDYCGQHILDAPDLSEVLQTGYVCCTNSTECEERSENQHAIYTTTRDFDTLYLVDVGTDGTRFGISYRVVTP